MFRLHSTLSALFIEMGVNALRLGIATRMQLRLEKVAFEVLWLYRGTLVVNHLSSNGCSLLTDNSWT